MSDSKTIYEHLVAYQSTVDTETAAAEKSLQMLDEQIAILQTQRAQRAARVDAAKDKAAMLARTIAQATADGIQ